VPYLAFRIHQYNQNAKVMNKTLINLKGIMVGNGCFDWKLDGEPAEMEFLYMHNVIDRKTYE